MTLCRPSSATSRTEKIDCPCPGAMVAISQQDAELAEIASLCKELNSFKEGRLDEPDYDRPSCIVQRDIDGPGCSRGLPGNGCPCCTI